MGKRRRGNDVTSRLGKAGQGDAGQRICERVRALGFATLADYLRSRPGLTYLELVDELGPEDLVGLQVIDVHLHEARRQGEAGFRAAAKDALARFLRQQLPHGWGRTPGAGSAGPDAANMAAFSIWASAVEALSPVGSYTSAVWERLNSDVPQGWLPESADDDLLTRMFDAAWPEG